MFVSIAQVTAEHHHDGFGVFTSTPRLSWRFNSTAVRGWQQASYDVVISRGGNEESYHVDSSDSVLVPWPSSPLQQREIAGIKVKATGANGVATEWAQLRIEVAILDRAAWTASLISGPPTDPEQPKIPFRVRKEFHLSENGPSRLYATAHGIYEVEINGKRVGDHLLAPGWQSYHHRLHYQTYDVTHLLHDGQNVIGAYVAEGWYAGRLGSSGCRNIWGERLGFFGQLEVRGKVVVTSDESWEYLDGPVLESEIYDGEVFDSNLDDPLWATTSFAGKTKGKVEVLPQPSAELIAPDVAPVRRIKEVKPKELITTPSGKKILDFGQNLVGWLRLETDIEGKPGNDLLIRHAEVLEHAELGTRPLRGAKAQSLIKLGGRTKGHEPRFTFFGFRYAEINGYDQVSLDDFTAIVISSDLRRTGTFECSHDLITKLHENTVWSTIGNFVSLPTDCPQRDERLGWTGDIQVFAPTANYLFDTSAFLGHWLRDLEADQKDCNGVPPIVIPSIPFPPGREKRPMAAWADASIITPWDLYNSFGDANTLATQWHSMVTWLEQGIPRGTDGLWSREISQYADWLDPRSPPQLPGHGPTDPFLVCNAYLIYVTDLVATIASVLGKDEEAKKYAEQKAKLLGIFRPEYTTPNGRAVCDTQTAYALLLHYGLFEEKQLQTARDRLGYVTRWENFQITTGFAGTPVILLALANNGMLNLAYRMLQARDPPSWLYPVRMGATTIWERWNSMLPDGTINPGKMTSFNHYALGSVCHFLHSVVGGLSAASPGWKKALVRPQPGGTVRHASTSFDSPYGPYSVNWKVEGAKMTTKVTVPPNGEARVVLNGIDETVRSGEYNYETEWREDPDWPPEIIPGPQRPFHVAYYEP